MKFKVGDYVQTWFDTGCLGYTVLYGRVEMAGPKTVTVRWESGIRNRLPQDHRDLKPANDLEGAAKSMAKVSA